MYDQEAERVVDGVQAPRRRGPARARGAGTLPPQWANLTGLKDLDVADNFLTGQLPAAYFAAGAFSNGTFMEARRAPPLSAPTALPVCAFMRVRKPCLGSRRRCRARCPCITWTLKYLPACRCEPAPEAGCQHARRERVPGPRPGRGPRRAAPAVPQARRARALRRQRAPARAPGPTARPPRQVYLNKLTGMLPAVSPNCPLCTRRANTSDGFGSGLTVQPMRAGSGAPARPGRGVCARRPRCLCVPGAACMGAQHPRGASL